MDNIERDVQFYMTLVTIQVENCLFRVPRQSLESQSTIFRDMFSLPVAEGVELEGSSDNNPIRLDGIKKVEFKRFLEVLFIGACKVTPKPPCTVFEAWFPVMKLARMWEINRIRQYAIQHMPYEQVRKTPAEKVALAVQYDIEPWLLPGLNELAKRKEPLGNRDLELLGPEMALKVAAVRESLIVNHSGYYGDGPTLTSGLRDASKVDFTPVIKRVFQMKDDNAVDEMDGMKKGSKRMRLV